MDLNPAATRAALLEYVKVEYSGLKGEQASRIGARDNLTYATLAATAAAVAGVLQANRPALLLAVPPVCVILGWTRLTNDEKVTAIGRYIRHELTNTARRLTADDGCPVFGWESHHRGGGRRLRKCLQLAVDLLTFCVPGLVAVASALASAPVRTSVHWWTVPAVAVDVALVVILAWQLIAHADLAADGWSP